MRVLGLACGLVAMVACVRTPQDAQLDSARGLRAAAPGASEPIRGPAIQLPARTVRLRFWAGDDYRRQTLNWQRQVREMVERCNELSGERLGVTFVIESLAPWTHTSTASSLEASLTELEQLDPGGDVDWVVGLVGAMPLFSASFDRLGAAFLLRKHFILHGMDDEGEADKPARAFDRRTDDERGELDDQRREHKEAVIFLHAWAHTLGAIHTHDARSIMYPTYDSRQQRFLAANVELIVESLEHWQNLEAAREKLTKELLAAITESAHAGDWDAHQKGQAVALLSGQPAELPGDAGATLTGLERSRYNQAIQLTVKEKHEEALAKLAPVAERRQDVEIIQRLACSLSLRTSQPDPREPCRRAAELAPASHVAQLDLANAHLRAGDPRSAAETLVATASAMAGVDDPPLWSYLVGLAQQASLVTVVEQAAEHSEPETAAEARTWARDVRRLFGLDPDASRHEVDLAREGVLVEGLRGAFERLEAGDRTTARAAADDLLARFPRASGPLTLLCECEMHAGNLEAAAQACREAIAAYEGNFHAHYFAAHVAWRRQQALEAMGHFEKALALHDGREDVYQSLAELYTQRGDAEKRRQLEERFRQRFSKPLEL